MLMDWDLAWIELGNEYFLEINNENIKCIQRHS